jgi:hypothetical protein
MDKTLEVNNINMDRKYDTGVIWYFDPHGKLIPGSIFIHGILTPLIEN